MYRVFMGQDVAVHHHHAAESSSSVLDHHLTVVLRLGCLKHITDTCTISDKNKNAKAFKSKSDCDLDRRQSSHESSIAGTASLTRQIHGNVGESNGPGSSAFISHSKL
jgi:hypothetical protein